MGSKQYHQPLPWRRCAAVVCLVVAVACADTTPQTVQATDIVAHIGETQVTVGDLIASLGTFSTTDGYIRFFDQPEAERHAMLMPQPATCSDDPSSMLSVHVRNLLARTAIEEKALSSGYEPQQPQVDERMAEEAQLLGPERLRALGFTKEEMRTRIRRDVAREQLSQAIKRDSALDSAEHQRIASTLPESVWVMDLQSCLLPFEVSVVADSESELGVHVIEKPGGVARVGGGQSRFRPPPGKYLVVRKYLAPREEVVDSAPWWIMEYAYAELYQDAFEEFVDVRTSALVRYQSDGRLEAAQELVSALSSGQIVD